MSALLLEVDEALYAGVGDVEVFAPEGGSRTWCRPCDAFLRQRSGGVGLHRTEAQRGLIQFVQLAKLTLSR